MQATSSTATLAAANTTERNDSYGAATSSAARGRAADSDYFRNLAVSVCPRTCGFATKTFSRRFFSLFEVSPECCSILWRKLENT